MIEYNEMIVNLLSADAGGIVGLNLFLFVVFAFLLSFAVDIIFGELPGRIHPVVVMGSIISFFRDMFIWMKNRISGLLVVICSGIAVSLILLIIYFIFKINVILLFIVFAILLSSTYSVNMLLQTAIDVKNDLSEDIDKARRSVSYLVSRSTKELTESFIVSAVIESMTENITDSYVAPIFYYFIFAAVILFYPVDYDVYFLLLVAMLYRLSNTMDAMLGYKTDELENIGFFPAKIDDILNYIPSRIAGIFVVISAYLLGLDGKNSFKVMMRDARKCPSPNSGYTMASTAGALNIQLIKKETYILGDSNKEITADDISRAVNLSKLSIILFTVAAVALFTLVYVIL